MMKKIGLAGLLTLTLASCGSAVHIAGVHPEKNRYITKELQEDPSYNQVISPYKAALQDKMNTVIAHTAVDLTKNGDNSNLGNLLADYTLEGARQWAEKNGKPGVDAAVINIGGIRSTIGMGNILTKHVYEVMPFENEVIIVKMTGKALQGLFDYYAKTQKNNPVSGFNIETDGGRLVKGLVNGKPPVDGQVYYIATSDYLAMGGDNMAFFSKGELIPTGIKLRDLFLEKFQEAKEVKPNNDARLLFKNKIPNNE